MAESNLPARLASLRATIEQLMQIGGTPGLSLNVVSNGNTIYHAD